MQTYTAPAEESPLLCDISATASAAETRGAETRGAATSASATTTTATTLIKLIVHAR